MFVYIETSHPEGDVEEFAAKPDEASMVEYLKRKLSDAYTYAEYLTEEQHQRAAKANTIAQLREFFHSSTPHTVFVLRVYRSGNWATIMTA